MGKGDGEGAIEVEDGLVEDLFPRGIGDTVEADDGVAGGEAVLGGGCALGNVVHGGGTVEVLVDLVVVVGDEEEQEEGEDEVEDGAGDGDEDALPAGLGGEVVVGGGGWKGRQVVGGWGRPLDGSAVATELAGHFDEAAEGEDGDAVFGIAVGEAKDAGAEADGEGFDADAAGFGDEEVAELVDQDEEAEDDGEFEDNEENMHEYQGDLKDYRQNREKFLCSGG